MIRFFCDKGYSGCFGGNCIELMGQEWKQGDKGESCSGSLGERN